MNIKKYIFQISLTVFAALGFLSNSSIASAATLDLSGSAWSGNTGWITFNCADTNTCTVGQNYKVTVDSATGVLSGYAWSDNIGWVSFMAGDTATSACATATGSTAAACTPKISNMTGAATMSGYAKVLAASGSWSGFINLSGVTVSASVNSAPRSLSGFAWGSDVVGWIDMSGVSVASTSMPVTVTLTSSNQNIQDSPVASNQTVLVYSSSAATSTTSKATSCVGTKTVGGVAQTPAQDSWVGAHPITNGALSTPVTVTVGPADAVYGITCTDSSTPVKSATATVLAGLSPSVTLSTNTNSVLYVTSSSPILPPNVNSVNAIQLTWTAKNVTSCTGVKIAQPGWIVQPTESSGTLTSNQWSGTLWSGVASSAPVTRTNTINVGYSPFSFTYSVNCVNSNTGKSVVSNSQVIYVKNLMGDIVANPTSVTSSSSNIVNLGVDSYPLSRTYTNGGGNIGPSTPTTFMTTGSFAPETISQSFIAGDTGSLEQINLYYKSSTVYGPYALSVSVYSDNSNAPGALLGNMTTNSIFSNVGSTLPANATTTFNWGSAKFKNVNIVYGAKYWIVISSPYSPWNHYYLATTPATSDGSLLYNNSAYSPSSTLYYSMYINNLNPGTIVYSNVDCSAKTYVNNIAQAAGDGWVASPMTISSYSTNSNSRPLINHYNKNVTVGPNTTKYEATCYNKKLPAEFETKSLIVPVSNVGVAPVIDSFNAAVGSGTASSPLIMTTAGGPVNLSWSAQNATSCTIDRTTPSADASLAGSYAYPAVKTKSNVTVPASGATYRLSCINATTIAPVTKNLTITTSSSNTNPSVVLHSTRSSVTTANRLTTLYWNSLNTAGGSCAINRLSDGVVIYSGSVVNNTAQTGVSTSVPGSTGSSVTYVIKCYDSTGKLASNSLPISIPSYPPAVVSFGIGSTYSPTANVPAGSSVDLYWNISNATCTAVSNPTDSSTGMDFLQGGVVSSAGFLPNVKVRNSQGTQIYSLDCIDPGNNAVSTTPVNITVTAPVPDPTVIAWAVPAVAKAGDSVKLFWTSTNASPNSCSISIPAKSTILASGLQAQMDNNATPPAAGYSVNITDPGKTVFRVTCYNTSYTPNKSGSFDVPVQFDPKTKKIIIIEH